MVVCERRRGCTMNGVEDARSTGFSQSLGLGPLPPALALGLLFACTSPAHATNSHNNNQQSARRMLSLSLCGLKNPGDQASGLANGCCPSGLASRHRVSEGCKTQLGRGGVLSPGFHCIQRYIGPRIFKAQRYCVYQPPTERGAWLGTQGSILNPI